MGPDGFWVIQISGVTFSFFFFFKFWSQHFPGIYCGLIKLVIVTIANIYAFCDLDGLSDLIHRTTCKIGIIVSPILEMEKVIPA